MSRPRVRDSDLAFSFPAGTRPRVALVNPASLVQRSDLFTSGILYLPLGLAYVASVLRQAGCEVQVVDALGEAPLRFTPQREGRYARQGLSVEETVERLAPGLDAVFVYAINVVTHPMVLDLLHALRARRPELRLGVFENSQAVTGYSLLRVAEQTLDAGAEVLVVGEPEPRIPRIVEAWAGGRDAADVDGTLYRADGALQSNPKTFYVKNTDSLPFPAWDLVPLENYWSLGYAHGPMSGRYLPLLTSRGCPYPCRFCVVPETNSQTWRPRSAENVVAEMEWGRRQFGAEEFHLEDLNPTIREDRMREIAQRLIDRGLGVRWRICAGTKIEAIKDLGTLDLMRRSGCDYLSFSPETGSPKVNSLMRKPFDHEHGLRLTRHMRCIGIRTQACFVLGFPGEDEEDRRATVRYVDALVDAGVDEIALFAMAPLPGADVYPEVGGYDSLGELTFSPQFREDYTALNRFRLGLYRRFLLRKIRRRPLAVLRQCINFLRRRFETKMEMAPYRALRVYLALRRSR